MRVRGGVRFASWASASSERARRGRGWAAAPLRRDDRRRRPPNGALNRKSRRDKWPRDNSDTLRRRCGTSAPRARGWDGRSRSPLPPRILLRPFSNGSDTVATTAPSRRLPGPAQTRATQTNRLPPAIGFGENTTKTTFLCRRAYRLLPRRCAWESGLARAAWPRSGPAGAAGQARCSRGSTE